MYIYILICFRVQTRESNRGAKGSKMKERASTQKDSLLPFCVSLYCSLSLSLTVPHKFTRSLAHSLTCLLSFSLAHSLTYLSSASFLFQSRSPFGSPLSVLALMLIARSSRMSIKLPVA